MFTRVSASLIFLTLSACYDNAPAAVVPIKVDTEYLVTHVNGRATMHDIRLVFDVTGVIRGGGPCNTYTAAYYFVGDTLKVGDIGQTRKFCMPAELMDDEAAFFVVLEASTKVLPMDVKDNIVIEDYSGPRLTVRVAS